jgi:hypothetical protein
MAKIGLHRIGLKRIGLKRIGLKRIGVDSVPQYGRYDMIRHRADRRTTMTTTTENKPACTCQGGCRCNPCTCKDCGC